MAPFSNKIKITAALLATFAAGLLAGVWGYRDAHEARRDTVAIGARRSALAIHTAEIEQLTATPADEGTPAYLDIKRRLMVLNNAHPNVQFIYLFRQNAQTGHLECLADSEPPGSPRQLRPGDPFPGQINDDDVLKTLHDSVTTFNGAQSDDTGRWISIYAPVEADPGGRTLMRLDSSVEIWRDALLEEAFIRALYVWLLVGVPVITYIVSRRHMRQALSIHKLNVAIEQSVTPMMIVNASGVIEYVNQGLCTLTGYTRRELMGKVWTHAAHATLRGGGGAKMETLIHEGRTWTEDLELGRKNGERYPANVTSTPVNGSNDEAVAYIVVIIDMTEVQRQAHELRLAKERAESADHAKSAFLATMSHEVRTPLNGIIGFSDLLLDTELTSEQREYALAIHGGGETLMNLTGNILDYSRIESGHMQLDSEPCDLRDLVEGTLEIVAPRAAEKKLQLLHEIAPDVPESILTDGGRLRQVLVNLLGNAIKFTHEGEVEVAVRRVEAGWRESTAPFNDAETGATGNAAPGAEDSIKLEFTVRDTGIGIASEDQARLFQPFTRLDSSPARRYEGAGLGLVISYDLVRLMGGNIAVISEPGKGTVFSFTIRCAADAAPATAQKKQLAGKRVALAVSHAGLARELSRELERAGAVVVVMPPEQLDQASWDLALIDCGERTLSFLRQYNTVPEHWHVDRAYGLAPIDMDNRQRQLIRPYFRALLGKPVRHRMLVNILAKTGGDPDASETSAEL